LTQNTIFSSQQKPSSGSLTAFSEMVMSRRGKASGQDSFTNSSPPLPASVPPLPCPVLNLTLPPPPRDEQPTLSLPGFLPSLGPSSLILFKHLLTYSRVLIYTRPPLLSSHAAMLAYAFADLVPPDLPPVPVLGVITLNDLPRLETLDGAWIACTTETLFHEKPSSYDLLLDLTTAPGRPAFWTTTRQVEGKWRKGVSRFTWSDVKLVRRLS
jgi:hypothetical protein